MDPTTFREATKRLHDLNAKAASLKVVCDFAFFPWPRSGSHLSHLCLRLLSRKQLTITCTQEYLVAMDQR